MAGRPIDETLRKRFETAWVAGRPEPIERFLPAEDAPDYLATLEPLIRLELDLAWSSWLKRRPEAATLPQRETGVEPPNVESYLRRFDRLNEPEIVLRLVGYEYLARRRHGDEVTAEEYRHRFPELAIADGQFESQLGTIAEYGGDAQPADTPALVGRGSATAEEVKPGAFGNYELLGEIGKGGMGIVYRARQRAAGRIVALKVIRRDRLEALPRDSRTSAVDRFWHEAQAAAQLEHDNIVTVYEVGEVGGQPFFSMRYVEGQSLAEILRDGPLEDRRAADYIKAVACAVHEAHAHGILHRDLKPQNILVDAKTGRALVADFGLAKLTEGGDELTRAGEVMGTPSYMSPEQARDAARVTAATDVYALGATLYHLVSGRPPFHAASPWETLRQVIDQEPVPPRQLNPSIHRDLETICLKCLEKEPPRRYGSAEALADDLGRYLRGEPIQARPIGAIGRTVRWCRRNPVVALLIASTFTFLLLALVATLVGYVKTSEALKVVEDEKTKTEQALALANEAKRESDESFRHARETVNDFYTRVSEDTLLNQPGMQSLRKELLEQTLEYYRRFLAQRGNDPSLRDELAAAHFRSGCITEEIDTAEKALAFYRHARRMQEKLAREHPNDRKRLRELGNTLNAIGRVLDRQGRLDEARKAHQGAVELRERLAREEPGEPEFRRTLANSYMNLGLIDQEQDRLEEARRQYEKAQALRMAILEERGDSPEAQRDLGKGYYNLARLELVDGNREAGRRNLEAAGGIFEALFERDPQDLSNQYRLNLCYRILADLALQVAQQILQDPQRTEADRQSAESQYEKALGLYEKALEPMERLAFANPDVTQYQAELAGLHMNRGVLQRALERSAEALESFQEAHQVYRTLAEAYPNVPEYQRDLGGLQLNLGDLHRDRNEPDAALPCFLAALGTFEGLIRRHPGDLACQDDFAAAFRQIALLQAKMGYPATARGNLEKLHKHLSGLIARHPDHARFRELVSLIETDLGGLGPGQKQVESPHEDARSQQE